METKRLFIGTFIDSYLFKNKYEELQQNFNECCGGKWVEPNNLHFTYQFLGDVEAKLIPVIKSSLADCLVEYNSNLKFKGIFALPKPSFPRVLYVKIINDDQKVINIQKKMEKIMTANDFQPETRVFIPHVTLLRIKQFERYKFVQMVEDFKFYEIGDMRQFKIDLIESQLTKEGPIYNII